MEERNKYIRQPQELQKWVRWITTKVGPWIKNRQEKKEDGKSLWELARFVSIKLFVLYNTIGRKAFGELIISKCPEAVEGTDTATSLKYSMDKYRYRKELKSFHQYPDTHPMKQDYNVLVEMYEHLDLSAENNSEEIPTVESRMKEYLSEYADSQTYAKFFNHPTYCNYNVTMSVEHYVSQKFMDERRPSWIEIYQCIDNDVDEDTISRYYTRFGDERKISIFIVSDHNFKPGAIQLAEIKQIGVARCNPRYKFNDKNFMLSRSSDIRQQILDYHLMLSGEMTQSTLLLIKVKYYITTSLFDHLVHVGIPVKSKYRINVEHYSYVDIETLAYSLEYEEVQEYAGALNQLSYTESHIPKHTFDPYKLIRLLGLEIVSSYELKDGQLGSIDIAQKKVYINANLNHDGRLNFTIAHEGGHYVLHAGMGVPTIICTTATVGIGTADRYWMEWQANVFASCYLMPADVIWELYRLYWQKTFGNKIPTPLTIQNLKRDRETFHKIVGPISRKLGVSMEAVKWRLNKMGLLAASDDYILKNIV